MESTKSDSNRVATVMTCPFCQEKAEGEYAMMLVRAFSALNQSTLPSTGETSPQSNGLL